MGLVMGFIPALIHTSIFTLWIKKEDSFKKALYEVGMFVFKASLSGGSLIWLYFKFGGVALF